MGNPSTYFSRSFARKPRARGTTVTYKYVPALSSGRSVPAPGTAAAFQCLPLAGWAGIYLLWVRGLALAGIHSKVRTSSAAVAASPFGRGMWGAAVGVHVGRNAGAWHCPGRG